MSDPENIQRRLSDFFPGFEVLVVFQPTVDRISITLEKLPNNETVAQVSADTSKKVMTATLVRDLLSLTFPHQREGSLRQPQRAF